MKIISMKPMMATLALAVAGAMPNSAEPMDRAHRVCAVSVQDRAKVPVNISGLDGLLEQAVEARGFDVVLLPFDRPADVEYAARTKGCTYILYTDIVRSEETAGSRTCRAFKRLVGADGGGSTTMSAEVEFRLFQLDEVLPLISTSVAGQSTAGRLSPHVSSRVVELQSAFVASGPAKQSLRATALSEAFEDQAQLIRQAVIKAR